MATNLLTNVSVSIVVLSVLSLILLVGLGLWIYFLFRRSMEKLEQVTLDLKKSYKNGLFESTAGRIAPVVALKVGAETGNIIDSKQAALRQDFEQLKQEVRKAHSDQNISATYVKRLVDEVNALQQEQSSGKKILDLIGSTIHRNEDLEIENSELKLQADVYKQSINESNRKLDESERALEESRSTEAHLQTEINAMAIAHDSKVAELESTHAAKVAELHAECEKLLAEKDIQMQNRETELQDAYRDFTQPDIASMFGFSLVDAGQGGSLKTVVYSYLAFLGRNMRENDFIRRFGVFDQELYHALRDDPDALETCRRNVERHIAAWNRKGCNLIVEWAQLDSVYNDELDNAEGGSGSRVDGVLRAHIFAVDEIGNRVCKTKGLVVTA